MIAEAEEVAGFKHYLSRGNSCEIENETLRQDGTSNGWQRDASITLNGLKIPQDPEDAKYLALVDCRLNRRKHIFTERKQLGIRLNKMYWLLGSKSQLSIENKLLL